MKGVYTSDIQYTVSTLPKQMGFKLQGGKEWFKEYAWCSIPDVELDHAHKSQLKPVAAKEAVADKKNGQLNKDLKKKSVKFPDLDDTKGVTENKAPN